MGVDGAYKLAVTGCDLCGGEPKCVEWCPEEALELVSAGEQNEMLLFTLSGKLIKGR